MGQTTPNIAIFIPAAGETNYDQAFAAGMVNIDQHDHSGGPNKGLPITAAGLAPFSVTFDKLNENVVDLTTGIKVSLTNPNQLQLATILSSIFNIAFGTNGYLVKTGTSVTATPIINNVNQPAFNYSCTAATQNGVTGGALIGQYYTVKFATQQFQQGTAFDGTSTFTAPVTGVYIFNVQLHLDHLDTDCSWNIDLVTTGPSFTYTLFWVDAGPLRTDIDSSNEIIMSGCQIIRLTAGQTVIVKTKANQAVDNSIDIVGGFFSGELLC